MPRSRGKGLPSACSVDSLSSQYFAEMVPLSDAERATPGAFLFRRHTAQGSQKQIAAAVRAVPGARLFSVLRNTAWAQKADIGHGFHVNVTTAKMPRVQ